MVDDCRCSDICVRAELLTKNARTLDGEIQREGEQVVVGDVDGGEVAYEVLCRRHHRDGVTLVTADRAPTRDLSEGLRRQP